MKSHERCSISGRREPTVKYHYFHRFFTYSVRRGLSLRALDSGVKCDRSAIARLAPKTVSGGEFDWGGTSVKS